MFLLQRYETFNITSPKVLTIFIMIEISIAAQSNYNTQLNIACPNALLFRPRYIHRSSYV